MEVCSRFDNHLIENRQVRIFLSSTFSDMQDERTELVKTFEILKVEAAKRDVVLSVVDLRWGVTEEEAKTGKVISICLEEIEHSHPFFIGILGNNYGTSPKRAELKNNPELKERYEWLNDAISDDEEKSMSITEMEIQYGVLKNNKKDIDAAFYFRKCNVPDNNERLTHLKEDIRKYCHSKGREDLPREYYKISDLCGYVMEEVRNVINKHFPETKEVTPLDRERSAQKAYINSRHSSYHERQSYYDTINEFVRDHSQQHLVFTGASGIGKSALLANWILKNEKNSDFNLIYHFVGNSFSGNSYESILRHICDEIYDLYDIQKNGNWNEKIEEEAQRLVAEVSQKDKQIVIVIDGINQIVTKGPGKEKLLLWLPSVSKNVKYIFSTLPDDETMDTFKRREYKVEEVCPLSNKELSEWIPRYLNRVGKSLDDEKEQLQRIVKWSLNDVVQGNMLVLRALLDELTRFGVYEKLDERIDYYTAATSIPDFFDRVLNCLEKDYSPENNLVKHALTLISVSEHGLSEDELMTILGYNNHPLEWELFFCAFYNHFVVKNGIITFSHHYIGDAIDDRYHINETDLSKCYRCEIVEYFTRWQSMDIKKPIRCDTEQAFQFYNLSEWQRLYEILLKHEVFDYYYSNNQPLYALYWRELQKDDDIAFSLDGFLNDTLESNDLELATVYSKMAFFIQEYLTSYEKAEIFHKKSLSLFKATDVHIANVAVVYNNMGTLYEKQGMYQASIENSLLALKLLENIDDIDDMVIISCYNNLGFAYLSLSQFQDSIGCFTKALKKIEESRVSDNPIVATVFHNFGYCHHLLGDYPKTLEYYLKALRIRRELLGETNQYTASSYQIIGGCYHYLDNFSLALEYYKKGLSIYYKVLGNDHPNTAQCLLCIGGLYSDLGNYELALDNLFRALEKKKKTLGYNNTFTANNYYNIGMVFSHQGKHQDAIEYYLKDLEINERLFGKDNYKNASSLNNIGLEYYYLGNYNQSLRYYFRSLKISVRNVGNNHPEVASIYNNIGLVYTNQGKYNSALKCYIKDMAISEVQLGKRHTNTADTYNNIGSLYFRMQDYENALRFFKKAISIFMAKLGENHPKVITTQEWIIETEHLLAL